MLSVFGDDSADETKQRVFAVAGVIASEEKWQQLENAWLDRTGGIPFHATDCDSDQGDYADRDHGENKKLYQDLVHILINSDAWGFGIAIDLAGFREFYPDVPQDMCYYKAFFEAVRSLSKIGQQYFNDSVKFTFDSRAESNYNAGLIYGVMVNDTATVPDAPRLVEEISFVSSRKQPRIQIGDLFARETMKELDNKVGPKQRDRRKSMEALVNTRHFGCDLLMREYFKEMREKTRELEKGDKEFNRHSYLQWLIGNRLPDTMSNRFRFLAIVNSKGKN